MAVEHDPGEHRFRLPLERGEARLEYRDLDADTLEFYSTWVEPSQRGRGLASEVVRAALDHARAQGKRVRPSCSYVRAFLRRHPEYGDLEA